MSWVTPLDSNDDSVAALLDSFEVVDAGLGWFVRLLRHSGPATDPRISVTPSASGSVHSARIGFGIVFQEAFGRVEATGMSSAMTAAGLLCARRLCLSQKQ